VTDILCTRLYIAFAIASAVGSLVMMGLNVFVDSFSMLPILALFTVWIIGPHLLGSFIGLRLIENDKMKAATAYLILLVVSLLSGFWIYLKVRFYDPPDAQSGLIFLSVPFVQWAVVIVGLLPAMLVGLIRR
jgi:hypothetical protein